MNKQTSAFSKLENALINIDARSTGDNIELSRDECFSLYRNWSFGKRIVDALPTYAMSTERDITFANAPGGVVERFKKIAKEIKQDDAIKRCLIYTRITGIGGMFVASKGNIKASKNLTTEEIQEFGIEFNALDSLVLTNNTFNQDPLSSTFMQSTNKTIQGQAVGDKRLAIITNGEPVYLRYSTSAYNYSGVSVFQNLIPTMKSHILATVALRRVAGKAGALIYANERGGGRATGEQVSGIEHSKSILNNLDNTGTASIQRNDRVDFFPMQSISELQLLLKTIEYEIMVGVSDTPKTLLLDESLVNGMAEGTNDFSLALLSINAFREKMMTPLYKFTDQYVMKVAFTDDYIMSLIKSEPVKYSGYSIEDVRLLLTNSFSYEYGSLIPEPESMIAEREDRLLQKIQRLKELGASNEVLEAELNDLNIFKNEIEINYTTEPINSLLDEEESGLSVKEPSLQASD